MKQAFTLAVILIVALQAGYQLAGYRAVYQIGHNFLGVYVTGALLHFSVIHRSFNWHGAAFVLPVLGAVALSSAVYLLV